MCLPDAILYCGQREGPEINSTVEDDSCRNYTNQSMSIWFKCLANDVVMTNGSVKAIRKIY